MKTILVPTDFSKNADNALEHAIALAKKMKAKIVLIHAFQISIIYPDTPLQLTAEQIAATEKEATNALELLQKRVIESGIPNCEYINQAGFTVDVILECIDTFHPDLVVMGTRGASGIREFLVGTNTAKVIEKARCPVIAVPEKAVYKPISMITYATDLLASDLDALSILVEFGKLFYAQITLLHVSEKEYKLDPQEEMLLRKFENIIKSKINYAKLNLRSGYGKDFETVLDEYITREKPDIIAMSTRHRNLIDKLFNESITKKMAYHTSIPLLAFHYEKEAVFFI